MPGVEPANPRSSVSVPPAPQRINQPDTSHDRVFTAADIEHARQQEKDKMYGRLNEMQETLRLLNEEREQRTAAEQARQAELDAEAERQRREETDLRSLLEERETALRTEIEAEREERARAVALLEKERQYSQLMDYRNQAVRAAEDQILPELLDEVSGNTPEEIDASIARLVGKTESILNNVGAVVQTQRQSQPSARVTAPPVGPLETETGQQQFSAQDINAMSMADFAKYRGQLGVTGGKTNRGLFG